MARDSRDASAARPRRDAATVRGAGSELLPELAADLRARRVILFVGSGISAGLGLPTWEEFIGRLGGDLGLAPEEFLALSDNFRSLAEFYRLEHGTLEDLCSRMAAEWRVSDEALAASDAHRLIVRLAFPIVYTTNYDPLLERAYRLEGKPFNTIITAKDIANSDPALPTVVKFHGDLAVPASVVLTETDYMRRLSFDHPLDIKLASDAFGNSVLFIGYSVSDINLRVLLYRLQNIWRASGCEDARPRSYVFMTHANRVQERILGSWGVAPLIAPRGDETRSLALFLAQLCTLSGH